MMDLDTLSKYNENVFVSWKIVQYKLGHLSICFRFRLLGSLTQRDENHTYLILTSFYVYSKLNLPQRTTPQTGVRRT